MKIKHLGLVDYLPIAQAMLEFTESRGANDADELWLCQHPPVYTLGLAGSPAHVLGSTDIPIVHTTRGGQVTYHGPGQIVAYPLVDLRRLGFFVKEYVFRLEESILRTLYQFDIVGHRVRGAPGVYVRPDAPFDHTLWPAQAAPSSETPRFDGLAKIAALGVKISNGCSYHGLALNVAMDLLPYRNINPCGYQALTTVDMHTIGVHADTAHVAELLGEQLQMRLVPA